MPSATHSENQTGFTLLELLIGLVLLSLMMTLLFGSIRMGVRVWNAGEQRAASVDRMLVVQNFLRRSLTTARPVTDDFSGEEPEFAFSGTADSLRFVAELPSSARRGGLHQFSLELIAEGPSRVLVAKLKAFYPTLSGEDTAIEDVRLVSDVESVTLSYFGPDESDPDASDPRWVEEWTDRVALPDLIKMVIRTRQDGDWPALIVSPKLASFGQSSIANPRQPFE